eukprot:13519497-Ditylum_brightwellii.AAC.1
MASFLGSWLATLVVRALDKSIADDTLDTLIAQEYGQLFEVAHCVLAVALFDQLFDLFFDNFIEILDLFACYAAFFGPPFSILDKLNLLEPLLIHDIVCGLNVLPAGLHKVAPLCVM